MRNRNVSKLTDLGFPRLSLGVPGAIGGGHESFKSSEEKERKEENPIGLAEETLSVNFTTTFSGIDKAAT